MNNIIIKNNSGIKVGHTIGDDVIDHNGNKVGYVKGSEIFNSFGTKVAYIDRNKIKSWVTYGYVSGNAIQNNVGTTVGAIEGSVSNLAIGAAALLLLDPPEERIPHPPPELPWFIVILMGAWAVIKVIFFGLVKYFGNGAFEFKGTATRKEWWVKCLLGYLVWIAITGILGAVFTAIFPDTKAMSTFTSILYLIIALFALVPVVAASVRRVHDIGKPGWWILIPIVGFVMCAFVPGKTSGNSF